MVLHRHLTVRLFNLRRARRFGHAERVVELGIIGLRSRASSHRQSSVTLVARRGRPSESDAPPKLRIPARSFFSSSIERVSRARANRASRVSRANVRGIARAHLSSGLSTEHRSRRLASSSVVGPWGVFRGDDAAAWCVCDVRSIILVSVFWCVLYIFWNFFRENMVVLYYLKCDESL